MLEPHHQYALTRILHRYYPVDPASVSVLCSHGSVEQVVRNEILFHERRFNAFEYFQLEGITHRFNLDADRHPITSGIYQGECVITPHFTRTLQGQSLFTVQALTTCIYFRIPAGTFRELSDQHESLRMFGRAVVEQEFVRSLRFEVLFRSYAAKERLLYFREHYPQLENLIPHTVIASFLGITPVSLSRLRHELARPE